MENREDLAQRRRPLLETDEEDSSEEEKPPPPPTRPRAFAVLAWLVVLVCGVTSLTLALVFPVKKHKFARTHCVGHDVLVAVAEGAGKLVEDVVPLALQKACGAAKEACDAARALPAESLHGLTLDAAASGHALERAEEALQSYCANNTAARFCGLGNVTAACVASAACDAASDYVRSPEGFCANATRRHADNCQEARHVVKRLEAEVGAYCGEQGGQVALACNVLNQSLHDRGHWQEYCKGFLNGIECNVVKAAINKKVDDAVCSKSQTLCDLGYAVVARWEDVDAPLPLLDVFQQAEHLYCTEGCGVVRDEAALLKASIPSICSSWPQVAAACANVTRKLSAFCDAYPNACDALTGTLNKTALTQRFVSAWERAQATCANTAEAPLVASSSFVAREASIRRIFNPQQPPSGLAATTDAACQAVDAVDAIASKCPTMLPLIDDAMMSLQA